MISFNASLPLLLKLACDVERFWTSKRVTLTSKNKSFSYRLQRRMNLGQSPLSSNALTSLREQMRVSQRQSQGVISLHEPPFFAYKPRGVSGEFSKLCRRTEIDDFHFHDLRHEATSRLKFRIHPPFRRPQDQLFIYEADSRAIMQFIWLMLTGEWTDGW